MSRRYWISLLLLGLIVSGTAAYWVRAPGYMDAEYYYTTAQRLADGAGFTEPFLWNYLDDPIGLPHPSHLYWMPLTTIVSAGPMVLFGKSFRVAQLPFLILAAALPALTALLALHLHGDQRWAWKSGLLAALPGFYLPYLVTTDTFILYTLIGGAALWVMADASQRPSASRWLLVGLLVGLGHLTRADGLLLLVPALIALWWAEHGKVSAFIFLGIGYLLPMVPWCTRNLLVTGSAFPSGTGRALWLLSYDELFSYPADILTPARWLSSGFLSIFRTRFQALGTNIQRLIGENGIVFLGPFMALGAHRLWKQPLVRLATIYLVLLLGVMSFIFPYAGSYGGFFHSSAALMPILFVLAPVGLDTAIAWGAKKRGWNLREAKVIFGAGAVALVGILTVGLVWTRVIGPAPREPRWAYSLRTYQEVGELLCQLEESPGVVAINNPPGFYLATSLESVVIPNGPIETLHQVVERYSVDWVVLDANRPVDLAALYNAPETAHWLELADTLQDSQGRDIYLLKVSLEISQP